MTSSPRGTSSAPPAQKSFCTSTMIRASIPHEYSPAMGAGEDLEAMGSGDGGHDLGEIRDRLRRVLLAPEVAIALDVHGRTDAAVLVPLYVSDRELHAVFTKRRDDLRRHAGAISFPGG